MNVSTDCNLALVSFKKNSLLTCVAYCPFANSALRRWCRARPSLLANTIPQGVPASPHPSQRHSGAAPWRFTWRARSDLRLMTALQMGQDSCGGSWHCRWRFRAFAVAYWLLQVLQMKDGLLRMVSKGIFIRNPGRRVNTPAGFCCLGLRRHAGLRR